LSSVTRKVHFFFSDISGRISMVLCLVALMSRTRRKEATIKAEARAIEHGTAKERRQKLATASPALFFYEKF
jgi:hypothetical protein